MYRALFEALLERPSGLGIVEFGECRVEDDRRVVAKAKDELAFELIGLIGESIRERSQRKRKRNDPASMGVAKSVEVNCVEL